ncbi:MAG: hypothetical protein Q9180_003163 [Flavoplaca navasiana]
MSRVHRPDFDLFRKERKTKGYHQQDPIGTDIALRFPHINTEDLSQPKPLLLMLDSRGRSFPSEFVGVDLDAIQVGIRSKILVPKYIRGYIMHLDGNCREDYGRVVSGGEDRQLYLNFISGIASDPGMGIFILEIQKDIMEFLVACTLRVLRNEFPAGLAGLLADSSLDTSISRRTPEPEHKASSAIANGPDSIAIHTLEARYRVPDVCDIARLRNFVEAQCDEVADRFLLLREDPGYFAEFMWQACSHTGEATVQCQFKPYSTQLSDKAWNEALSQVLMTAFFDAYLWQSVAHLFDQLMIANTQQKINISNGHFVSDDYGEALIRLNYVLNTIPGSHFALLPSRMATVPTFKKHIAVAALPDGRLAARVTRSSADHLYWLFTELVEPENREICCLPDICQEIERLISKDARQKGRLDRHLIMAISDLAVTAEIQRQLILSTCNKSVLFPQQEEIDKWACTHIGSLREIRDTFHHSIFEAQLNGFTPLVTDLRVFEFPSDKPRTAANVAKMRSAEHALDDVWEKVDERCARITGKGLKDLGAGKIQHHDIQRTPPWTESRPAIAERRGKDIYTEELDVSLALSTLEERTERTIDPSKLPTTIRDKVKTRGRTTEKAESEDSRMTVATKQGGTSADNPLRLPVRKKAFNTFATLFGKPLLADRTPGELPWTDFKKAMVNVGFGAEKLQGSAWLFESKYGSIIFHEPHPQSKLPMHGARRIARRLNRNFGWTAETFVLEVGMENDNVSSNIP